MVVTRIVCGYIELNQMYKFVFKRRTVFFDYELN